ncbi:2OG-Fe(II) oxygenase [Dyella psychrodurans]|uniref:2-oxoglutarate-dependent dioxygenase n=1 Tax=Dyella psychrodurans TaxID=1927960 RepID=A0A370WZP2_9GAMM|nr:2OG-Fe(II) oxygenase [Dyella psychrodurans]RDS81467.1 2-oxoglutarate-dependent dioxygenase [Dyella psychrodurans]
MNAITHLPPEWQKWIRENLARGCAPQSLIDDMVRNHFDPVFARAAVNGVMTDSAPLAPAFEALPRVAAGYVYEKPRLPAGNLIRTSDRDVRIVTRVKHPMIAVLDGVLSIEECDELIRRSADKMHRSTTVDPISGKHEVIADRSSEGTFFQINADPFIARLDRRIAEVMNSPVDHGEGLQVLHYGTGGEYKPHFDYFPPEEPGSHVQMTIGGQRVSTMVMYLNEVEEGGTTIFPEIGLEVVPKKGSAVYFEYTNSHNQLDRLTLHGGSPVTRGEKWIVTKWMRQRRYGESAAG